MRTASSSTQYTRMNGVSAHAVREHRAPVIPLKYQDFLLKRPQCRSHHRCGLPPTQRALPISRFVLADPHELVAPENWQRLIPRLFEHDLCAHLRNPMDMMRHG